VQHAPHSPESHNLNGLVCESRFDYQSAAAAYRRARCTISSCSASVSKSYTRDISLNLARSLTKVNILDIFFFPLGMNILNSKFYLAMHGTYVVSISVCGYLANTLMWCRQGMLLMLWWNVKI